MGRVVSQGDEVSSISGWHLLDLLWLIGPVAGLSEWRTEINPRPHCGICGGQSDTVTGLSPSTSVFPCQYHSTIAPYSFIHPPPTLYNNFLPVLQFAPVSIIPFQFFPELVTSCNATPCHLCQLHTAPVWCIYKPTLFASTNTQWQRQSIWRPTVSIKQTNEGISARCHLVLCKKKNTSEIWVLVLLIFTLVHETKE